MNDNRIMPIDSTPSVLIPTLNDVLDVIEELWPAHLAESWDASGLVTGRLDQPIKKILWAVDPVRDVVEEAVSEDADLLITHHPLYLKPVNFVAANTFKGEVIHTLIENKCALIAAHTNGDSAVGGVSDVIAGMLGIENLRPLAASDTGLDQEGIGRVGELPEAIRLDEFATKVFGIMPSVAGGIRVAGDPTGLISRVAVCGGAGDSLFEHVRRAEADVYITADLRHHPASEAREQAMHGNNRPYLIDVSHFASEWLWLPTAARQLQDALYDAGFVVTSTVSTVNSDPWDFVLTSGDNLHQTSGENS